MSKPLGMGFWAHVVGDPEHTGKGHAGLLTGQGDPKGLHVLDRPAIGQPRGKLGVGGHRADRQHRVRGEANALDQALVAGHGAGRPGHIAEPHGGHSVGHAHPAATYGLSDGGPPSVGPARSQQDHRRGLPACDDLRRCRSSHNGPCLLYTSPSPRDATLSRMPSSA